MDLELKELGQTLAIGALTILGLWLLFKSFWYKSISENKLSLKHFIDFSFVLNGIVLALVFAIGILIEDISKHVVAQREPPRVNLLKYPPLKWSLEIEKSARFSALFDEKNDSVSFKSHAKKWFNSGYLKYFIGDTVLLSKLDGNYIKSEKNKLVNELNRDSNTNENILLNVSKDSLQSLKTQINYHYYNAKDYVFQKDNYYKELNAINTRIDFTRSLTFLSSLLCPFFALIFLISVIIAVNIKGFNYRNLRWSLVGLILFFFLAYFGSLTNAVEMSNFNLRVFGYYEHILKEQDEKSDDTKTREPETEIHNFYTSEQSSRSNKTQKPITVKKAKSDESCRDLIDENKRLQITIEKLTAQNKELTLKNNKTKKKKP